MKKISRCSDHLCCTHSTINRSSTTWFLKNLLSSWQTLLSSYENFVRANRMRKIASRNKLKCWRQRKTKSNRQQMFWIIKWARVNVYLGLGKMEWKQYDFCLCVSDLNHALLGQNQVKCLLHVLNNLPCRILWIIVSSEDSGTH
jgi:hypothetical protein